MTAILEIFPKTYFPEYRNCGNTATFCIWSGGRGEPKNRRGTELYWGKKSTSNLHVRLQKYYFNTTIQGPRNTKIKIQTRQSWMEEVQLRSDHIHCQWKRCCLNHCSRHSTMHQVKSFFLIADIYNKLRNKVKVLVSEGRYFVLTKDSIDRTPCKDGKLYPKCLQTNFFPENQTAEDLAEVHFWPESSVIQLIDKSAEVDPLCCCCSWASTNKDNNDAH